MKQKDYNKLINNNMLGCWGFLSFALIILCFLDYIRNIRNFEYFIIYSLFAIIPLIITYLVNKKYDGTSIKVKYLFVLGYLIFYTFAMFTSISNLTFVLVLPMIVVLTLYCDKVLIVSVISYVCIYNLLFSVYRYIYCPELILTDTLREMGSFYELEIVFLIIFGVFLYKTTNLLLIRKQIIEELSNDALTDLNNVRYLEDNKNGIFNVNKNKNLTLAFIDVDDFKQFNTLYGHKFGDVVLQSLGNIINENIKDYKNTFGIRVGGDEFAVISRSLNKQEFCELMEKIRKEIEDKRINHKNKLVNICVSIGIASNNDKKMKTFTDLYNLADYRNSEAKKKGKNTIVSS